MNTTQNKLADALRLARTELEQWLPNEAADDATNAALEAVCAALAEHDAAKPVTFPDCVSHFAAMRSDEELAYVAAAQSMDKVREGELEVDDEAIVSMSASGGAYVMAWIWVDAENEKGDDA